MSTHQQALRAHCSHPASLTNIFREEHDKKWSDQVINPLHVAAGWVSDGPDKQDSFKDLEREKESQVLELAMPRGKTEVERLTSTRGGRVCDKELEMHTA